MAEETKFSIISPESVKLYGEVEGLSMSNIPDEIAKSLAEDVTYRIRETIQHAAQFMKHAKRRRLTTADINRALNWSGTEPIYGYGSIEGMSYRCTTVKETDIFSVEDKEIGLRELALGNAVPANPGKTTVKAYWLCIEGNQTGPSSLTLPSGGKSTSGSTHDGAHQPLSEASLTYYEHVTKAIMGDEDQSKKVALSDLKTNPKVASLLAHFVNFIASGVKIYSHNLLQLSRLLSMVTSLVDNPSLFLEPYVIQLVTSVMYCLLESLAASLNPANDHWRLRDDAACILAHISRKCSNPVNYLRQQLLMTLQEVLLDDGRPYCSHYGAVMGLTELGPEALEQYLFPHLKTYWNQLRQVLDDSSQSNTMLQEEACQVYGALLEAAGCLLRSKQQGVPLNKMSFQVNNSTHPVHNLSPWAAGASMMQRPAPIPARRLRSSSSSASNPNQLYHQLYEVFGDSLTPRVAINNWQDPAVTRTTLLRIQPIAHAYFPLRPVQRNSNAIRELIHKASEKMKEQHRQREETTARKRPRILEKPSPAKAIESKKEQTGHKNLSFVLCSPIKTLSNPISTNIFETDSPTSKVKGDELEYRKKSDRPPKRKPEFDLRKSAEGLEARQHRRLEIGNIKRQFRRTRPIITNGTKYDFHLGVTL